MGVENAADNAVPLLEKYSKKLWPKGLGIVAENAKKLLPLFENPECRLDYEPSIKELFGLMVASKSSVVMVATDAEDADGEPKQHLAILTRTWENRELDKLMETKKMGIPCMFADRFELGGESWNIAAGDETGAVVYTNQVDKNMRNYLKGAEEVFIEKVNLKNFRSAVLLTTATHECGHGEYDRLHIQGFDPQFVGQPEDVEVFWELAADLIGAVKYADIGIPKVTHADYITGLLGEYASPLNKDSVYETTGKVLVRMLEEVGSIRRVKQKYEISDAKKGIEMLADKGQELLNCGRGAGN